MGTVTFTIPAFTHGVHTDRVLSVQMILQHGSAPSYTLNHEFNIRSLLIAEAHNGRNAAFTERVATQLRELANDLDAIAQEWHAPPPEPGETDDERTSRR